MSLCLRPLQLLLVVLGVPMNGNGFLDLCALITAGDNPDPLLQQIGPDINLELLRPHSETRLKGFFDTEEEEDNDGSG